MSRTPGIRDCGERKPHRRSGRAQALDLEAILITTAFFSGALASAGASSESGTPATEARAMDALLELVGIHYHGSHDEARLERLDELPEWRILRELWQRLDAIEAGDDEYSYGYGYGTMDWQKAQELRAQVDTLVTKLSGNAVDSLEAEMLRDLLSARIELFSYGVPSMMTRMIPAQIEFDKGSLLQHLELRIDVLQELLTSESLETTEVATALVGVLEAAESYLLLDCIQSSYLILPYGSFDLLSDTAGIRPMGIVDSTLKDLRESMETTLATMEELRASGEEIPDHLHAAREACETSFENMERTRAAMPGFLELVAALELGQEH